MSSSSANERSSEPGRPRHAGVWVRVAANILDLIIMGAPLLLVFSIVFGPDPGEIIGFDWQYARIDGEQVTTRISFSSADLVQLVLLTVFTILLWVNWDGRTPGKKLLRIRIVSYPDYQPFAYGTALIRMLVGVASVLPLLLGYVVIALMVALRNDKRGYHDLVARTCVIHDE